MTKQQEALQQALRQPTTNTKGLLQNFFDGNHNDNGNNSMESYVFNVGKCHMKEY